MHKYLYVLLFVFSSSNLLAQENEKVELIDLIREIQVWDKEKSHMSCAFWIPNSYWRIALSESAHVTEETITQIETTFKDYIIVCGVDLEINSDGSITFTDDDVMKKSLTIIDANDKVHKPLKDDDVSKSALDLFESIKPALQQALGALGQGMHFYFFRVKDKNDEDLINEYQSGGFTVEHSNRTFEYSLPLIALLPPKFCPKDGATMKGNWQFCPIHGAILVPVPQADQK